MAFVPQIGLLFLFIGVMEDVGYLARVAFVIDRVMGRVGPARQVVRADAVRLLLRGAGRDGDAHAREAAPIAC